MVRITDIYFHKGGIWIEVDIDWGSQFDGGICVGDPVDCEDCNRCEIPGEYTINAGGEFAVGIFRCDNGDYWTHVEYDCPQDLPAPYIKDISKIK